MRRQLALLALLTLAACAGFLRPRTAAELMSDPLSPNALKVEGELAIDDDVRTPESATHRRYSDTYQLGYAKETLVRVWVQSAAVDPLELTTPYGRAQGQLLFQAHARSFDLTILGTVPHPQGPYTLVIDPPPDTFQAPPRNTEESRRAKALQAKEWKQFALSGDAKKKLVHERLSRLALDGKPMHAPLEQLRAVEIPVDSDHCYRMLLKLDAGARFSDLARRGLEGGFTLPERQQGRLEIAGDTLVTNELCPDDAGTAQFKLSTKSLGFETELGQGPVTLEVYSRISSPFADSAVNRDRAAAKAIQGHALKTTVTIDLAKSGTASVPLQVGRGQCTVAVVRLNKGAKFGKETRRAGLLFDLDTNGMSFSGGPGLIGPGLVSDFGCVQRADHGALKLWSHASALGTGTATVQVYTRTAPDGELRRLAAEDRAERADSNRRMAEMKSDACRSCLEEKINCSRRGAGGCFEGFLTCVRSKGYAETACGG